MRWMFALSVILLFMMASCETPVDSGTNTTGTDEGGATPPIVEVVKNDTPAVSPITPVPDTPAAPVPATPSPTPVESVPPPAPAPTPPPVVPAPKPSLPPIQPTETEADIGPAPKISQASLTDPLSEEAKVLIAKADEKIKSYDFMYAPPPDNLARDKYYIKGTQMKIELFDRGWFNPDTHMTAVYIDASTKTATGFCEDNRLTHCPDPNRRFPASYDTYSVKTPYQWLKEIQYGVLGQGEKLNERMTQKISYSKGESVVEQWLDEYSGLPMRVRITNSTGQYAYDFRDVNINSVTDTVFAHSANE